MIDCSYLMWMGTAKNVHFKDSQTSYNLLQYLPKLEGYFQSLHKSAVQYSKEYTISYLYEGQVYSFGSVPNSFQCGRIPRTPYG